MNTHEYQKYLENIIRKTLNVPFSFKTGYWQILWESSDNKWHILLKAFKKRVSPFAARVSIKQNCPYQQISSFLTKLVENIIRKMLTDVSIRKKSKTWLLTNFMMASDDTQKHFTLHMINELLSMLMIIAYIQFHMSVQKHTSSGIQLLYHITILRGLTDRLIILKWALMTR